MWFYLLAAASLVHTYYWGAGLACLAVPRAWRRWWWVFAPGFGLALQSAVVWAGAHTDLAGTRAYAWPSELIPLAVLGLAWWRGAVGLRTLSALGGAIGAAGLVLVAGWLLVSPMAEASSRPTSLSLGSCDSADYAAGARVMLEFGRHDRTGFLGLPEVTHVRSVDYFFDFWLRLNHFTPSAVIAHNAVILDSAPHELTSLTGVMLALGNVPLMLFLARITLGLRGAPLLVLAALMAFSPLQTYAVHHTALGQLLAAQGVMMLTVAVWGAVRLRSPWATAGLVLAGFCILAGGYNMILPVCLAPAGGWLLAQGAMRRDGRGIFRVCAMLAAMLAVCAVLFWTRFAGLVERFSLFEQYNFGWPISRLTPEGWLGLVSDPSLTASRGWIRGGLLLLVAAGWLLGIALLWRRRRPGAAAALMFVLPVAAGWAILDHEARVRANASYDAYKLLAIFQAELVIGLAGWFVAMQARRGGLRFAAWVLAAAVLACNLAVGMQFRRSMARAPLKVDRTLLELARIEADPRVGSVNLRVEDFWARMWANAFLLRKPQYFLTHSYEGRLDTPLRGEWDLSDSLVWVLPEQADAFIPVNERFHLVRAGAAGGLSVGFLNGWYEQEWRNKETWRWAAATARLSVRNPAGTPVRVRLNLTAQAVAAQQLRLNLNGASLGGRPVGLGMGMLDYGEVTLPPGDSVLTLEASEPARVGAPGDARLLSFAVYGVVLQVLAKG